MIDLGPVLLLRPLWLLGLPLALAAAVLMARRADGLAAWRRLIAPQMLALLRARGWVDEATRDLRPWLLGAAAALLALGLAGPATRNRDAPAFRNLDVLMILVDLSPSVVEGGGLDDAQAAVSRLVDRHGTRPVALALFSGESFLVSVPTEETEQLQTVIGALGPDTMPVAGSRPDRAFALARQTLADASAEAPDVVLVSDGGGLGPEALHEVGLLRASGARVWAVAVSPASLPYGMPPPAPGALEAVARAGGGRVVPATAPDTLAEALGAHGSASETELRRRRVLFTDHGRWAVALACLALLPLFRRRAVA
ncbi:VWA domain-containing protein (plasmid) [Paroceanicella profunda]|uniref:VWA domain-containing protein n=1 Tax=Paroceanicella profunda TaxID=2579971 RepID=A0A5B8G2F9_9RHOB|nr:vWA domain-containing protein [Paroceanicella profunda]QDL94090.1 VWA domain-containing protein [Paroceanicella profunda]